jgi:hypothetical protein
MKHSWIRLHGGGRHSITAHGPTTWFGTSKGLMNNGCFSTELHHVSQFTHRDVTLSLPYGAGLFASTFVAHSSHHSFCKMSSRPWGVLNAIEGNCKQTYSSVSIKECWLQFRGNCVTSSIPDRGFIYLQTRHWPMKFLSHHALTWAQKCFLTPMYIWSVWPSIWGWKVQNILLFRLIHRTNVPKLCIWFGARDLIWVWPAALGNLTLLWL